jgi:hypothetical protein
MAVGYRICTLLAPSGDEPPQGLSCLPRRQSRDCFCCSGRLASRGCLGDAAVTPVRALGRRARRSCPRCAAPALARLPLAELSSPGDAGEAAALALATQEFVANGGGRSWSAPPQRCIAGADGQPWPCRWAWLVAFRRSSLRRLFRRSRDPGERASRTGSGSVPVEWGRPSCSPAGAGESPNHAGYWSCLRAGAATRGQEAIHPQKGPRKLRMRFWPAALSSQLRAAAFGGAVRS